jgi:hypothetical protein
MGHGKPSASCILNRGVDPDPSCSSDAKRVPFNPVIVLLSKGDPKADADKKRIYRDSIYPNVTQHLSCVDDHQLAPILVGPDHL